jgi:hypothetical protein
MSASHSPSQSEIREHAVAMGSDDLTRSTPESSQNQLQEALKKINELEDEIECLTGVMAVMKEDLQVC